MGFFSVRKKEPEFLFICSAENMKSCKMLADSRGLTASFVERTADNAMQGHASLLDKLSPVVTTYVVFDTSLFSYSDMLRLLEENSRKNVMLGTYNPRNRTLITDQEVVR